MKQKKSEKSVLILAGGTGGHIFPALEIALKLKKRDFTINWIGTKNGLETGIVPKHNIPLHYINISGIRGTKFTKLVLTPLKILVSFIQSIYYILKIKPDIVIGMGGFVSGPAGLAAFLLNKKLIIHEQNSIPGTTNKILSLIATKVLYAFPGTFKSKNNKFILTGNPIREEFKAIPELKTKRIKHNDNLNILILGGSRGAKAINECIPETLAIFKKKQITMPNIWHQTGESLFKHTQKLYTKHNLDQDVNSKSIKIFPFIENIHEAYAFADIVICRSGALTISELVAAKAVGILIPFPYAIDDHQTRNACYLSNKGAGILLPQHELNPQKLFEILNDFVDNKSKILDMIVNLDSESSWSNDASERVISACLT